MGETIMISPHFVKALVLCLCFSLKALAYDYSITFTQSNPSYVVVGNSIYIRFDLTLIVPVQDYVELTVSGLPSGATASFPDIGGTTAGEFEPTTLKIATTAGTTQGDFTITLTGTSSGLMRSDTFEIHVEPVPDSLPYNPVGFPPAITSLAQWETNMEVKGMFNCGTTDVYYDAERVYYNIKQYTGSNDWNTCIADAEQYYRDDYLIPGGYQAPGYNNFTKGLRFDYERTADEVSADAVLGLSQNAAYADPDGDIVNVISAGLSREVSYAIMSYIDAEMIGNPRHVRLEIYIDVLIGHFDQWFRNMSYRCIPGCDPVPAANKFYFQPFMVGLGFEALIQYYEEIEQDPRIPVTVKMALDWMWEHAWDPDVDAWWYQNWIDDPEDIPVGYWEPVDMSPGAPDLNMLVTPANAWLYRKTGDTTYQEQGDEAFAGGVAGAYLDEGKQFNQNYRWSFDYVTWRSEFQGVPNKSRLRLFRR